MTKIQKIILALTAIIAISAIVLSIRPTTQEQLGAIPIVPALFDTALSIPQGTSDTSAQLASGTLKNGGILTGYVCVTVDANTSLTEYECGTASSTKAGFIDSITRGIDPVNGTSSIPSLIFSHRAGADVRITDYPAISIMQQTLNGNIAVPNVLFYSSSVASSSMVGALQDLASVAYVNSVAVSGAGNASTTTNGLVQFATPTQTSAGTLQGSSGAFLVPQNSIFRFTPQNATSVPVSNTSGKISQGWLDLTANWTFSGTTTFATTTIASATINGLFTINSATTTFANPPLVVASTTLPTQLATKQYVDTRFSYGNSTTTAINSTWNSTTATTTIATLSYTPPIASRVMVNVALSASAGSAAGNGCSATLFIDNISQTAVSFSNTINGTTGLGSGLSFSFVTGQLSATAHTFNLSGLVVGGGSCAATGGPSFSILNVGN